MTESEDKYRILYVDDEDSNLFLFELSFNDDFEVITANSPEKALEILERENKIHMIISDQCMPRMSGVELLGLVKDKFPNAIKMIISGYVDYEEFRDDMERNGVKKFIHKPYSQNHLKKVIEVELEEAFGQ